MMLLLRMHGHAGQGLVAHRLKVTRVVVGGRHGGESVNALMLIVGHIEHERILVAVLLLEAVDSFDESGDL